jgi:heterodisulfide reductase subunit A2
MKSVVVIGGGIAGLEAAACLSEMGHKVTLFEKQSNLGGNVANWHKLFPSVRDAKEVAVSIGEHAHHASVNIKTNAEVDTISRLNDRFNVVSGDKTYIADALLIATGFQLFDSSRKEEFGYNIYDNVISSADLEKMFASGKPITNKQGKTPSRIAIIHCVGSRDEKVGNHYCSKVCCITGVKQAIELRQLLPDTEIICFYIDLRMYGSGFEELYREAQEKYGIQFIRGRLSEAAENFSGELQIKAEDTLSGRPIKMNVDLMVLLAGMVPSEGTVKLGEMLKLENHMGHFMKPLDIHLLSNYSNQEGVFFAGSCTGPMAISDTLADARSAATMINKYLN